MPSGEPLAACLGAAVGGGLTPYLARLVVSVPDRANRRWWAGSPSRSSVVAGTALFAVGLGALTGPAVGWSALLPAWLALAVLTAPLAMIDIAEHRLPDRLVLPAGLAGAVSLALAASVRGEGSHLVRAAVATALVLVIFVLVALVAPFGLGDVKLSAVLAGYLGYLGWGYVLYGLLAGFVLAAVVSLLLLTSRRASLSSAIPLGPALIAGTFLVAAF